ncbi:MAG: hypothetical protein JWP75_3685 [Frondihabitans sp.]|nr:hypothetical protein [Frondihabitans sp.]
MFELALVCARAPALANKRVPSPERKRHETRVGSLPIGDRNAKVPGSQNTNDLRRQGKRQWAPDVLRLLTSVCG